MGRRLFTSEFKLECAELVLKQGYKVKDAADAMNIGQPTLPCGGGNTQKNNWV